jgi:hypothetical protein
MKTALCPDFKMTSIPVWKNWNIHECHHADEGGVIR